MIKCNVTVYGRIKSHPEIRTNAEQKKFLSMLLSVEIVDSNGQKESVEVSLSKKEFEQNELCLYKLDDTIEVKGDLLIRKRDDKIYLNLYASQIKPITEIPQHGIRGDMMFRGKVGKNIEEKTGKSGKPFVHFSAFSAEKVAESFEYVWVNFILSEDLKTEWLKPETKLEVEGDFSISLFKGKVSLTCFPKSLKQHIAESN